MSFDAADMALFCDPAMPGYAVATLAGGATAGVLFGAPYAEVFGMVAGNRPVIVCPDGQIDAGDSVTVNGTAYTARQVKTTQRGGMVSIELEAT